MSRANGRRICKHSWKNNAHLAHYSWKRRSLEQTILAKLLRLMLIKGVGAEVPGSLAAQPLMQVNALTCSWKDFARLCQGLDTKGAI